MRQAAGVSGSQMTHYFRDKHALIQAVIAWRAESVVELHQHRPLEAALDAMLSYIESFAPDDSHPRPESHPRPPGSHP